MKKSLFFLLFTLFIVTRPFYSLAQPIFVADKPDTISTNPLKIKFGGKLVGLEDCGVDYPDNVIGNKEALRIQYNECLLSFFGEWELNIDEFYVAPNKRVEGDYTEAQDYIKGGLVTYYDSHIGLRWESELTRGMVTVTYTVKPKTMTVHFTKLDIGK